MNFWERLKSLRENPKAILNLLRGEREGNFYSHDFVKDIIYSYDFTLSQISASQFIDYDEHLRFYEADRHEVKLGRKVRHSEDIDAHYRLLPYKEVINFVTEGIKTIDIIGDISPYQMPDDIRKLTQTNFEVFLKVKPKTTDGPILRIADFQTHDDGRYTCKLETSSYFYQVRTNLTLDYEFKDDTTLRALDLTSNKKLPTFTDSKMVNSIGVSSVVVYRDKLSSKLHFLAKLRKGGLGIFNQMIGTTSGVVEIPKSSDSVTDLVAWVTSEMKREFEEETGISQGKIIKIIPLAFMRELMRGGKPQFFFLIEIDEKTAKSSSVFADLGAEFDEFEHDISQKEFDTFPFSPEYATNLIYAFMYFEQQRNRDISTLML